MDKKSSRDKLLEEAEKLFAEKGYTGVGIRDISSAANVNSSAVSYYFKSKQGLYREVLESKIKMITDSLNDEMLNNSSPVAILTLYAETVKNVHRKYPCFIKMLCHEMLMPTEVLKELQTRAFKPLAAILRQALRKGCAEGIFVKDLDVDKAIMMLVGSINFYYMAWPVHRNVIFQENTFAEDYVDEVLKLFFRSISEVQEDEKL